MHTEEGGLRGHGAEWETPAPKVTHDGLGTAKPGSGVVTAGVGGEREVEASRRRPRGDGTIPRPDRGHGQRPVVAQIYLGTTLPRTEAHARAHTLRMHVL